jgi:MarR family transcriptional regulator, transcriptional regulator for hemolysin
MEPMSPSKSVGFLLHDVARLLRRRMDQRAQALGLTSAQWRVLAHVAKCETLGQEPLNQTALADLLDMEPISLSRHIDRAEAASLIERRPDPTDRRAHRLFLTDSARPLVASFRVTAGEVLNEALSGISEKEVAALIDVLDRIRVNVSAKPEREEPVLDRQAAKALEEESRVS